MKKRILGFFVAIVLVLTGLPVHAELIDVYGTKYEEAVQLLCDIGVLESVSADRFEPGEQVKRSDAARYITALSGVLETGAVQIYTDVPESHPAFGAVYVANQLGIVAGVGDGLFSPDSAVSAEQAAKMLVVLAGYTVHAEAAGGYPAGYLMMANRLDILKGVSTAEPFTKGELALMMYNTLFVNPAEKASYGTDSGQYATAEENLLARNLHIFRVKGQVTANAVTAVRGATVREGEASIEGTVYLAPKALAQKIGRKVVAYYKENEQGIKEVISFVDVAEDADSVVLEPEDILPETSPSALVYQREEDERAISVSISANTVVLYNGGALSTVTAQDLKPLQGSVCVTEDANGDAAVIVVENYDNYVVEDVNPDEGILYYKENAQGESGLNFMDPNVYYQVTDADGKLFDLQSCAAGTVVSVMKSRDGKVCTLIACTDKVSGVITEKTEEHVFIDGKGYLLSASFTDSVPALGDNVQFALDYTGKVADNAANFSARKYGYLMAAVFEGKGLSQEPKVKLLTRENEIKVFTVANSVKVNGVTIGKSKLFNSDAELSDAESTAVSAVYQNGAAVEQLVVYEVNGAGEIMSILTAEDRTDIFERDRDVFSLQFEADSGMFLAYGLRMFNSKYRIPTDSVVFSVAESYTGDNDEQYKAMTGAALEHVGHYPGLKLYDFNEENEAAVMVTKLNMQNDTPTYTSKAVLVKSVSMSAMEDGEICEAVRIVGEGGTETTLYNPDEIQAVFKDTVITDASHDSAAIDGELPSHITLSQLRPGDVIKYSAVNDTLSSVIVCFRADSPKEQEIAFEGKTRKYPSESNDYYQGLWVYSKVIYAGANGFRFLATNHNGVQRERIHTYGSATVLIFDKDRQTIKVGKPASLTMDDMFFASRHNAAEHLIVIYR